MAKAVDCRILPRESGGQGDEFQGGVGVYILSGVVCDALLHPNVNSSKNGTDHSISSTGCKGVLGRTGSSVMFRGTSVRSQTTTSVFDVV